MSKVLLGFVDEHIKTESCSDDAYTVNKIGGLSVSSFLSQINKNGF